MKQVAIIGAIAKYTPSELRLYVNSITKSGFIGKKIMLVYDVPTETTEYLKENGWEVYRGQLQQHVILQRFYDVANLIDSLSDVDYIIWTDVRDVIFQNNITDWLFNKQYPPLVVVKEGIRLQDEQWAVVNCGTTFPEEWNRIKQRDSVCTGIIGGTPHRVRDLFKEMYRWSITSSNPEQLADQAALNVLLSFSHFDGVWQSEVRDGLGAHMGVIWQYKDSHRDKLTQQPPRVTSHGQIVTTMGNDTVIPCIIHQYDRDPILKVIMEKLYGA